MSDRTAVLVTGSREWTEPLVIASRLAGYPSGTILLHGGARGADTMAANWARVRGWNVWELPYFSDLGKAGGHARNGCLVNLLVTLQRAGFRCAVEAFPRGASPGTRGCIRNVEATSSSLLVPFVIRVTESTNV